MEEERRELRTSGPDAGDLDGDGTPNLDDPVAEADGRAEAAQEPGTPESTYGEPAGATYLDPSEASSEQPAGFQ